MDCIDVICHEENTEQILSDGSISFVGQNIECIPPWLLTKYGKHVNRIDLSYNKIRSLKGLVGFTELKELILDNNQLSDDMELPRFDHLETLTVNKNLIKNLEGFLKKISFSLPKISYLSLLGNEACPTQLSHSDKDDDDYLRYRYFVLHNLPTLKFLDSSPVTPIERKEAKRVGGFMNVKSCKKDPEYERIEDSQEKHSYTALPSSEEREGNHRSSFGKCHFIYYGKNSEGNRFILNNDL